MKKAIAVLVALLALTALAYAYDNHTRWNNLRGECTYFYATNGQVSTCVVAEEHCTTDGRNRNVNLPASACGGTTATSDVAAQQECAVFQEGDLIRLAYDGSDRDGDELTYTVSEPFDDELEWQTERGDAGNYTVTVAVSDGTARQSAEICFSVESGNHVPVLRVTDVTVNEGETVTLKPECSDADGDAVSFDFSGDITRPVWVTGFADGGTYKVTVTCTDTQGASDSEEVTVTVRDMNRKPELSGPSEVRVTETDTITLPHTCEDPEGQDVNLSYSGKMTTKSWRTTYDDAGNYSVTVTCEDESGLESEQDVRIVVQNRNRAPTITAMVTAVR